MKKYLFIFLTSFYSLSFAECTYSPIQEIILSARTDKPIIELVRKNTNFLQPQPCGGSILQLAVLRGNPSVLKTLLENGAITKEEVSLKEFPIKGAPEKIPLILFAAYYAPNTNILSLLMQAGFSVLEKDSLGNTILWYIKQNKVLHHTDLEEKIKTLLISPSQTQEENTESDFSF